MIYAVYHRRTDTYWLKKQFGVWRPRLYATRRAAGDFARAVSDERLRWAAVAVEWEAVIEHLPRHGHAALLRVKNKETRLLARADS